MSKIQANRNGNFRQRAAALRNAAVSQRWYLSIWNRAIRSCYSESADIESDGWLVDASEAQLYDVLQCVWENIPDTATLGHSANWKLLSGLLSEEEQ